MIRSAGASTTVRFFEELYAIVVGLGLALAAEQMLDLSSGEVSVQLELLPLFLAYLNFAFPLAHASVRYLDLAYVERQAGPIGKVRVLGDLGLGIGHFLWLIALSFLIGNETAFLVVSGVLLIGRPARDLFARLGRSTVLDFDRKVAAAHIATVLCLLVVLGIAQLVDGDGRVWVLRVGGLISSLVFALGLYLGSFSFFFGTDED